MLKKSTRTTFLLSTLVFFNTLHVDSQSFDPTSLPVSSTSNAVTAINAGGPLNDLNETTYEADQHFNGGATYTNLSALLPDLYKSERNSPAKTFQYNIPLSNGDYTVVLHFAEIYWGATGGGPGGSGLRVFDVSIEDNLVLDNYDIYAEVGAETIQVKSFDVNVSDGVLTIDFSSLAAVGGVDQPKVSAIEIVSGGTSFPPLNLVPIADLFNSINNNVDFGVAASGGDPNANFTYQISGQPQGVQIEPTTGLVTGVIAAAAASGGLNSDGVHNVTVSIEKPGSSPTSTSFDWTIANASSCLTNDLSDSNLARFETLSEAVDDKLYMMGGWLPGNPNLINAAQNEIYDTTNDIWSFGAPMPIPVTHMGSTVVGDEIWSVAGFAGDNPGIATNVVQIYNTVTDTWRNGPSLPIATGSGDLALSDGKLHYFGGLLADRQTDIGNHYVLDLANESAGWSIASPLPNPRNHFSAATVNGLIYAIGGQFGHDASVVYTNLVHSYDPNTDQWTRLADLPVNRSHFEPGTTIHNGKIIIVGGENTTDFFDTVLQYDPQQNLWTELCRLPEKLASPAAKVFNDRLIVTGGSINGFTNFSNATRWLQLESINPEVVVLGEMKKWHPVSLMFTGPETSENASVNPFLDYRLNVLFTSPTAKQYIIPGFYAADGNAAETSAVSGNKWMARFSPDEVGEWTYSASFRTGSEIAVSLVDSEGIPTAFDGISGTLVIGNTDKALPDNRSKGMLEYVDERYLKFRETGEYFLKAGSDSPENFLAYSEFDNTLASKDWSPHIQDWTSGNPVWKSDHGKGIVGAINYLSNKGMNAFSFLTMNVNGDGKDVWPWSASDHSELDGNSQSDIDNRLRYDVSKLEQWEKVFEHGDSQGMFLNFKTQETENDQLLDGGQLGVQRKLYYRELIARFGHHLALNWNLGEEYDIYQELSDPQNLILKEYIEYIDNLDAYDHPIVVHSFIFAQDALYNTLLGPSNTFTGPSLQSDLDNVHVDVVKWLQDSDNAGKPWVVSNDEQGDAQTGVSADFDYTGNTGTRADNRNEVRHKALWGTLMGGGDGVEYYFGYSTGETDLTAQDFRSRAHKWEDAKLALDFFDQHIPFWRMQSDDQLISNSNAYCLSELGESYLIYLPSYEATTLDLSTANGTFTVRWFDPENGGNLQTGGTDIIVGGSTVDIGSPPIGSNTDWVVLIEKIQVDTIRINVGGPELTFEGEVFESDGFFLGGREYINIDAQVPELYQSERSSLTNEFLYEIPVSNGNHIVKLHFADIYFGANGGGPGGVGSRVFDVFAEGGILLDDYDIIDDVGTETTVIKTFEVFVEDGFLSLAFDALGNDGIDQPKLSALEVIGPTEFPGLMVTSISNRSNLVNETVDFEITAAGGNPNVDFLYSISGQPDGIEIEPTSGVIFGVINSQATTGGTNNDGIHNVVISVEKPGSASVSTSFVWSIFDNNSQWVDKNENESYEAKGESGFVQAGDKFYVIGGIEDQKVYAYDYVGDSWTDLGEAPIHFNHFQPIEYKGLIWIIGALKDIQYPNNSPSEYIWIFDPIENEWIQGPEIPQNRVRGSAGLVVHNDKFYLVGGTTNGHDGGYAPWLDEFDPSNGAWRILPDAPRPRDHFYATKANNKLYTVGGRWTGGIGGFFGPNLPEVDVFDFITETWETLPVELNLPTPRAGAPVTFFENKIMVMGGEIASGVVYGETVNEVALQITEGFDVVTNSWSRLSNTAFPRHGTNAIVSGEAIYMASGAGGWGAAPPQNNMEYYGVDSPEGEALVKSNIVVPSQILFSDNQAVQITADINSGNMGLFLRSIEIIGVNAGDFEIIEGNLENVLLSPNSQYELSLMANNQNSSSNAILRFNYGANSFVDVGLSTAILVNPGDQTSTLGETISLQIETNGSISNFVFSASNLPEGLSIDESTGLVSGVISGVIQDSPYSSEVSLLDEITLSEIDKVIFSWDVNEVQTNGVVSFTLVDADTNQDILLLTDGMQLDASQYAGRALSVRVETEPSVVGSVSLQLSGALTHVQTENFAPYALFGDNGAGNYTARLFPIGNYFLSATAYMGSDLSATAYPTSTISFSIIETTLPTYDIVASSGIGGNILPSGTITVNEGSSQQYVITPDPGFTILEVQVDGVSQGPIDSYSFTNVVDNHSISATFEPVSSNGIVSFTLVDADTNQDILSLTDGMQLDATQYAGRSLSVRVETEPSVVGSVSLQLGGALTHVQTENFAPYTLFGDFFDDYFGQVFPLGNYTISATAFSESNLAGSDLGSLAIQFSIVNALQTRAVINQASLSPNPAVTEAILSFDNPVELISIQVFDMMGRLIKGYNTTEVVDNGEYILDIHDIPSGTYFVNSYDINGIMYQKQLLIN